MALPLTTINGEGIVVLRQDGSFFNIYYPDDPASWEGGECTSYSVYVDVEDEEDPMVLADQSVAKADDGTWYICSRWDCFL